MEDIVRSITKINDIRIDRDRIMINDIEIMPYEKIKDENLKYELLF